MRALSIAVLAAALVALGTFACSTRPYRAPDPSVTAGAGAAFGGAGAAGQSAAGSGPIAAGAGGRASDSPRAELELSGADWKFFQGEPNDGARADSASWTDVSVPHTWNAEDGQDGAECCDCDGNYRRGPGWYAFTLKFPESARNKRAFLLFEGASIVSDVYVNGMQIGSHVGAFGAFSFEVTSFIDPSKPAELKVRVDNTWRADVAPLSGDFTVFGGLYRPVRLIITDRVNITPLDYASPGVYISQKNVDAENADVSVLAKVSNGEQDSADVTVRVTILDAGGVSVAQGESKAAVVAAETVPITTELRVEKPHLWQGINDPYLYTVRTQILSGEVLRDQVDQPLGLRSIRVDPVRGFLLNELPHNLRGVNRHQDRVGKGWAIGKAEHDEDFAIIREIGANSLRLAHYPHSSYFYDLCDTSGLLVWAEIPLVNEVKATEAFASNAKQQLVEMIRQHYNHPAIFTWGLYNEIGLRPSDDPIPLINSLQETARSEDTTRPTVAASFGGTKTKLIHRIPDLMGANIYPGWYYGTLNPSEIRKEIQNWQSDVARPFAVSEYGAGASPNQHQEGPPSKPSANCAPVHPEEYQSLLHESVYGVIAETPSVWGSFVWNMFDFASDGRKESDAAGRNDKGLVTFDRKTRKDAFFFYKANWNPEPMVHIGGRRLRVRTVSPLDVKVYSNCSSVELSLNGSKVADKVPDATKVLVFENISLAAGDNVVRASARCAETLVEDEVRWTLE